MVAQASPAGQTLLNKYALCNWTVLVDGSGDSLEGKARYLWPAPNPPETYTQ